jgi:transcriptional regulator with XRE-family HTH domain
VIRVEIKPDLLSWARQRAGIDPAALAQRFPKLAAWEQGTAQPTLKQVEDFAKATHTPVGFLFFKEPPVENQPSPDTEK